MFQRKEVVCKTFKRIAHLITSTRSVNKMGHDELSNMEPELLKACKSIVPALTQALYKGQAGRVGVIGGSIDYTGAPYFAAISALKVGCDLSHVFCTKDAAPVIKSYSPELIVHPVLNDGNAVDLVKPWLPRLHVLVIGPGLGRDNQILQTVSDVIKYCRDQAEGKPLVIDADGLFMITEKPDVIKDYPHGAILTPNAIEFTRLAKSVLGKTWDATPNPDPSHVKTLAEALGTNIVILHKGASDIIASGSSSSATVQCTVSGSGRRCGGQGDLLSGSIGTFYCWALREAPGKFQPAVVAAYAGCSLTRECNRRAFAKEGRSTLTTDMIKEIHSAFSALFEN